MIARQNRSAGPIGTLHLRFPRDLICPQRYKEPLAPAVARYGVKTTIVEPGPVATDVMAPRRFERLLPNERIESSPYPEPWELLSRIIANTGGVQPVEEVGPQILSLHAE